MKGWRMSRSIRNIDIQGRRTSLGLEASFWKALRQCAKDKGVSTDQLANDVIGQNRGVGSTMTSAIRVFLIGYFQHRSNQAGAAR